MQKTFTLKIISFENIVFQGEVDLLSLPGKEGRFGVEPRHMNIAAVLNRGTVRIISDNKEKNFSIPGGTFFFEENNAILLIN